MTLYNDNDAKACAWVRGLIKAGLVTAGKVDERPIEELGPSDLAGVRRFHAFCGIAGWDYALSLAGFPRDRNVWTASLPCQPWSCAGKGRGVDDERHLWPVYLDLVKECRPELILGEQVAAAVGVGWLDGVFADLEAEGYTCGAIVLGSHSVGAPNIRQRLYWVAESESNEHDRSIRNGDARGRSGPANGGRMGEPESERRQSGPPGSFHGNGMEQAGCEQGEPSVTNKNASRLADTSSPEFRGQPSAGNESPDRHNGETNFWSSAIWHPCRDGKARRIAPEPEIFPLVAGLPGRVGLLRGAGNAINPVVASTFVRAYMEL